MTVQAIAKLKALLDSLPPALRRRWLLGVPLVLAMAVVEALAALAIVAFLALLTDPPRSGALVTGDGAGVARLLAGLAGLVLARSAIAALLARTRSRAASETEATLSTRLLANVLGESYMVHLRRDSSEIMRDVLDSSAAACATLAAALSLAASIAMAVAILLVVLAEAPLAGAVAVACAGALAALAVAMLRRRATRWGADARALGQSLLAALRDALGVFKEARLGGHEPHMLERFARLRQVLARVHFEHALWTALPRPIIDSLFLLTVLAALLVALARAPLDAASLPLLGLYLYAGLRLLPAFHGLVSQLIDIRVGLARTGPLLATLAGGDPPAPSVAAPPPLPWRREIVVDRVDFTYAGSNVAALEEISLRIARAERLGIAGATGAGKSTLADLLMGLLVPSRGGVHVDGEPLAGRERAWQRGLGYARSGTFLIDDSLRRNVALGVADVDIDAARLDGALRVAQLEPVLRRLAGGADARLGEAGATLSAGERQRVGLARALYHRPALLIFDEAFSALDQHTEACFFAALADWLAGATQVIVSHRPATLARCDRVVLLHAGRIEAIAAFDTLMARNERFDELMSAGF